MVFVDCMVILCGAVGRGPSVHSVTVRWSVFVNLSRTGIDDGPEDQLTNAGIDQTEFESSWSRIKFDRVHRRVICFGFGK